MRDVATEELDPALRGRELARDDIEQGCLPRTVGSEDGATLAWLNGERHIGHRPQAAEPPPDPPQVEDRRGGFGFLHLDVSLVLLVGYPKVTGTSFPTQGGGVFLVQVGFVRSGSGVDGLKKPPNVWSTFGTRRMVWMPGSPPPAGGAVIWTIQLSKIAWRLESRVIGPYGPSTVVVASAA